MEICITMTSEYTDSNKNLARFSISKMVCIPQISYLARDSIQIYMELVDAKFNPRCLWQFFIAFSYSFSVHFELQVSKKKKILKSLSK